MAKTCLDVNSGMPNVEDVEDRGSLGNGMGTVAGSWFSNQKKDIVRVGMYERTKQHHQAWQLACLNNLYDNFCRSEGINEATVRSRADVEKLLTKMFLKYGIHFYWDPDRVDPLADHPCNLMRHCREPVIRLTDLRPRQAHLRGRGGNKQGQKQKLRGSFLDCGSLTGVELWSL